MKNKASHASEGVGNQEEHHNAECLNAERVDAERVVVLEEKLAFLEDTVEQLHQQFVHLQEKHRALELSVISLKQKLSAIEDVGQGETADNEARPPHY